jgi:hypothetical protein
MMKKKMEEAMRILSVFLIAFAYVVAGCARADDVSDFYRGRQIQMIIGYGPGGGYDLNARLLARHMVHFIPGAPIIIAQNMPGVGAARAASYVHSAAPRDGTVIGAVDRQLGLSAVLGGNPAIKFGARDINWLGTLSSYANDAFVLWVRKDAAAKSTAASRSAQGYDGRRQQRRLSRGGHTHEPRYQPAGGRTGRPRCSRHGQGAAGGAGLSPKTTFHGRTIGGAG